MTKFCSLRLLMMIVVLTSMERLPTIALGQEKRSDSKSAEPAITPESMGFTPRKLETDAGSIHYYLSSGGRTLDANVVKPLVVYLDGSGPSPFFWGKGNRIGSSLMFSPDDFPDFHYVVLGKPGVQLHEIERRIESKEYDRTMSLDWRVDSTNAVINELMTEEFIDSSLVLVVGHSEGADVAPWVAAGNEHVTHVAGLAPGGISQMLDFVLFARKQVEAGIISKEEGDKQVREYKDAYRSIFADPLNTEKKWQGETYLRWSSFFRPAMEAWCQVKVPVYLGYCRDDKNTPVECGEAIELEFIRLGKKNLTSKLWLTDHYFQVVPQDEQADFEDRRLDVLREIREWATKDR